jgi:hypothetical protein
VASSKNSKKRKQAQRRQQAQHRQSHQASKARARDDQREHLPKTGTAKDDEYLLRRSREDLHDFGLARSKGGITNWILAALVVIGVLGLIVWAVVR